jgi:hypothetical protein
MTTRIFISSVQKEFAQERKALAECIRKEIEPQGKDKGRFRLVSHARTEAELP